MQSLLGNIKVDWNWHVDRPPDDLIMPDMILYHDVTPNMVFWFFRHTVNREVVFSGLADLYSKSITSLFSFESPPIEITSASALPTQAPCSWRLHKKISSFRYLLKESSTVRYPFYWTLTCNTCLRSPIIPRNRTLFRNIYLVSSITIREVHDGDHHFLRYLSSLPTIYS